MKKHLVYVCGGYYPHPSPTALCGNRYIRLFEDEYDVEVIAWTKDGSSLNFIDEQGNNVHLLTCKRLSLEGKAQGVAKNILHKLGSSLLYLSYLGNQRWYANAIAAKLEELSASNSIDVVFSVCSPLAAHVGTAAFKMNHPEVKTVAYTVDPYSTTDRIKPICKSLSDLARFEKETLNKFDYVFLSEEVYDNRPNLIVENNCYPLPYLLPPMHQRQPQGKTFNLQGIHCVYAGSFYEDIRNPEYMLESFSRLSQKDIYLHLYSKGCEKLVDKYRGSPNIVVHGLVSSEELNRIYSDADILIGIGNSMKEFMPSKTFEYVATQKPIIYFNYQGLDNVILDKYPLAIQISMDEKYETSADNILKFCKSSKGKTVDEDLIVDIYSKHSSSNIKQLLSKAL